MIRLPWVLCALSLLTACGGDESSDGKPLDGGVPDASGTGGVTGGSGDSGAAGAAIAAGGEAGTGATPDSGGGDDSGGDAGTVGGQDAGLDAASGTGSDASSNNDGSDGSVDDAAAPPPSVEDIQQGDVTGQVTLFDVYVTAIDNVGANRGIWVADALAAAAWQGIFVATGASVPAVSVGETVSVTGTIIEFDQPATGGDTLTEITTSSDQISGTAAVGSPTAVTVAADVLADITNGEAYESVLVHIGPVRVTSLASGNRITVTDNDAHAIVVDDDLFTATPAVNDCYSSIVGVMTINLADDERRLLPRAAGDLTTGGGCN